MRPKRHAGLPRSRDRALDDDQGWQRFVGEWVAPQKALGGEVRDVVADDVFVEGAQRPNKSKSIRQVTIECDDRGRERRTEILRLLRDQWLHANDSALHGGKPTGLAPPRTEVQHDHLAAVRILLGRDVRGVLRRRGVRAQREGETDGDRS